MSQLPVPEEKLFKKKLSYFDPKLTLLNSTFFEMLALRKIVATPLIARSLETGICITLSS